MSGQAKHGRSAAAAVIAFGLASAAGGASADAAVISVSDMPPINFSSHPAEITIAGSGLIFSDVTSALPGDPPAQVRTAGSAEVTSLFGGVADFGSGASIDQTGELYTFTSFATASVIPNSAADDFIGFDFTLADGVHYGYAEVTGTDLVGYGFETVANTGIVTGAVPEPATVALLGSGLLGLAGLRRRRDRSAPAIARTDGTG